jgi:uncharacterized protein YeaO (DUF488 family)
MADKFVLERVYDSPASKNGTRFLVERLWPRGIKKEALHIDGWLRDVAPSTELRKWFSHDPAKWQEFRRRYFEELKGEPDAWKPILDAAKKGTVVLLYSAHDTEHNAAVALKEFLNRRSLGKVSRTHVAS